ncbi:hypothetical protein VNO77_10163 [Canavalia gladiata]|uniref:Dof zinc finger protein n=1 Tax=Canavalia gladiata TaxID=3824 RepID=A0AAN9QWZ1_CANGL
MFPQTHSTTINVTGLDQMLHHHHLPSSHVERSSSRWKPSVEVAPNCPRCASTNTKFCYYNNYSLSQPRYFCKACRRYWTKGGSLRNVPVGGGCRKNRRGKSSKHHQNANASVSEDRESSMGETHDPNQTHGSRDIDMALVFAKFLNQKPSDAGEELENGSSSTSNNYLTPENVETENNKPLSDSDAPLTIENFGGEELSLGGIDELERFLAVDEHLLWSDDAATMSSSITWQPPPVMQMQFHEFQYSMPFNEDSQLLPITSASHINSITDAWTAWNSFDLSNMEVFSSTP